MEWTSISWAIGLILASPFLGLISKQLDHGYNPQLIARAASAIGSLFCLHVGFIKTPCIFPFYIAAIVALYIVASASHTRHLGLMARGYTGPTLKLSQSPTRRGVSGWFSVYATAAFTYHMLRNTKAPFVSLWIVSIFRVLKWLVGMLHIVTLSQGQSPTQPPLCPNHIHCPFLKILICCENAISGFPLSSVDFRYGILLQGKNWQRHHVLLFAAIQSTSAGLLHAFGRVLLLDCTSHGKEGAFSVWHSWVKALGTCTGFAVASAISGNVSTAFGVSFLAATIGILILIFGDISDVGGDMVAGHLHEASEKGSPVPGLDTSIIIKEHAHEEIA
ncbi:hypothetical protein KPL71_014975 [Citrus sinensis]|uniref:Uncharacterized protein n=1 Tax=Citrus sinensis TaxID=2711 RepID=A0ACB8KFH7_CITSI|nr:hypothetical protein KPL71_014975 [Citrus sinensis]